MEGIMGSKDAMQLPGFPCPHLGMQFLKNLVDSSKLLKIYETRKMFDWSLRLLDYIRLDTIHK
jgi:hypothetical protein